MPATTGVHVSGLRDLNRALARASKDVRREVRAAEREIAEPVRSAAERNAVTQISHIGIRWSQMRIGVTQRAIYVAPKARRRKGSPRPNLAALLMDRAMQPALDANAPQLEARIDQALDRVADIFNRSTVV